MLLCGVHGCAFYCRCAEPQVDAWAKASNPRRHPTLLVTFQESALRKIVDINIVSAGGWKPDHCGGVVSMQLRHGMLGCISTCSAAGLLCGSTDAPRPTRPKLPGIPHPPLSPAVLLCKAAAPHLNPGGSIIFISSYTAFNPAPPIAM